MSLAVHHYLSNPFDIERVESDVIVLYTGTTALAPTGVGRRLASPSSPPINGNVTIEFYTRDRNTSTADAPDECGAVFSVNASGTIGLETALEGACATWDATALQFKADSGCTVTNASMSAVDGTWLLQCDCVMDKDEIDNAVAHAIVGYVGRANIHER